MTGKFFVAPIAFRNSLVRRNFRCLEFGKGILTRRVQREIRMPEKKGITLRTDAELPRDRREKQKLRKIMVMI